MLDAYYTLHSGSLDAGRLRSSPATAGPWSDDLQHGGPPNALAVAAAETAITTATARTDLIAVRLAADFVRPVPVAEIETRSRVVRAARSAALVEVTIGTDEYDCLLVRVWFVADRDTAQFAARSPLPPAIPDAPSSHDFQFGYGCSLDWRFLHGGLREPGPGAAWVRATTPLVRDHDLSGLGRTVLVADSASGISSELDWRRWSFVNIDLDVHLARPLVGEWVLMQARTQLGGNGCALARSTLSDERGEVGAGLQTLVLAAVPT